MHDKNCTSCLLKGIQYFGFNFLSFLLSLIIVIYVISTREKLRTSI